MYNVGPHIYVRIAQALSSFQQWGETVRCDLHKRTVPQLRTANVGPTNVLLTFLGLILKIGAWRAI